MFSTNASKNPGRHLAHDRHLFNLVPKPIKWSKNNTPPNGKQNVGPIRLHAPRETSVTSESRERLMKTDDDRGDNLKGGGDSPENLLIIVRIISQMLTKKRRPLRSNRIMMQGRQAEGHFSHLLSWWLAGAHVAATKKSFLWFTCYFECWS